MNTKNKEIELSILGSLIISPDLYPWISDMIHPDIFNLFKEEMTFIIDRLDDGKSFDKVTIINLMTKTRGGGENSKALITTLVNEAISLATDEKTIVSHCHVLIDEYKTKNISREANDLISRLHTGQQPDESLSTFTGNVEMLNNNFQTWTDRTKSEAEVLWGELDKIGRNEITGIPSAWEDITHFTGGWQKGDIIIVGARPGMGKTTFVMQNVIAAAEAGHRVGMISLGDLNVKKLGFKAWSMYSGVGQADIRQHGLTNEFEYRMKEARDWFRDLPVNFLDTKDVRRDITSIKNRVRKLVEVDGVEMLIIDYIQLIRYESNENRNLRLGYISEDLKDLAVTLDIPIILPSQLSRDVEKRGGDKKPLLSDLRDSGTIEQAADHILFLWRPGYYDILEDEEGNDLSRVTDVLWRKYREAGELVPRDFRLYFKDQKLQEQEPEDNPFTNQQPKSGVDINLNAHIEPTKVNDDEIVPF